MDLQQQPEFFAELLALAEALDVELSDRRMEIYWRVLEEYDWPTVQRALAEAMRRKWYKFPQPGELVELIEGSPEEQAEMAWQQAQDAMAVVGAYRSLVFDDAAIAEAVRMVFRSWSEACLLERDGPDHAVKRREFLAAYRAARQRSLPANAGYLGSLSEASHVSRGLSGASGEAGLVPLRGRPHIFDRLALPSGEEPSDAQG